MSDRRAARAAAALILTCAGCVAHDPAPLDPDAILAAAVARRERGESTAPVSLADAAAALRPHNPRVREAWAEFRVAAAPAGVPTPADNPVIGFTPSYYDGPEVVETTRRGLEAALGWALPLTGVRAANDGVLAARRDAAHAAAIRTEREEYLRLRRAFADLALRTDRTEASREMVAAARAAVDAGRTLVAAGEATALDVQILQLEAGRQAAELQAEEEALDETRTVLATATGLRSDRFAGAAAVLPAHIPEVPPVEDLRAALARESPALAALRAEHGVAEEALRLEVARQFPSLEIGFEYEREGATNRFGLPLGISVPVFDRNQQGIAEAVAARDLARVRFEAAVDERLAAIEGARARLVSRTRRLTLLRDEVEPAAQSTLALARRSLPAGAIDALRYLEVVRGERAVRLEVIAAQQAVHEAWADLEEACGVPFLVFPGEPGLAAAGQVPPNGSEGDVR